MRLAFPRIRRWRDIFLAPPTPEETKHNDNKHLYEEENQCGKRQLEHQLRNIRPRNVDHGDLCGIEPQNSVNVNLRQRETGDQKGNNSYDGNVETTRNCSAWFGFLVFLISPLITAHCYLP
jgi:hypothetical protein